MSFEVRNLSLADICCDVSYGYTESATSAAVGPKFLRITGRSLILSATPDQFGKVLQHDIPRT